MIAVHLKRTKSLSRGQLSDDPVAVKGIGDDSHLTFSASSFPENKIKMFHHKIENIDL